EIEHQKSQVENLRTAMRKLEQKLTEAQAKSELLIAKHRRSQALTKASRARMAAQDGSSVGAFDRMKNKIQGEEAMGHAMAELANENAGENRAWLEKNEETDRLRADIKAKPGGWGGHTVRRSMPAGDRESRL